MSQLAETQWAFAAALLDPALPVPDGLRGTKDRFAVYRNNVMIGLIEALRDVYPVVCRLVGEEFFKAMAAMFARSHPPRSPVMLEYGAEFAEFIAGFPPAKGIPYLADVALLERAWAEAYHAADAALALETQLPATNGEHIAPPRLHPAAQVVCSPFPILTIWNANLGDAEPEAIELSGEGENVLVSRPDAEVQACCIPDDAVDLMVSISSGRAIALDDEAAAHLRVLCSLGAFAAWPATIGGAA